VGHDRRLYGDVKDERLSIRDDGGSDLFADTENHIQLTSTLASQWRLRGIRVSRLRRRPVVEHRRMMRCGDGASVRRAHDRDQVAGVSGRGIAVTPADRT